MTLLSDIVPLIRDIQNGTSKLELLSANKDDWLCRMQSTKSPNYISVLDSSFNPPTLAHHALAASSSLPPDLDSSHSIMLLLSVRNVDKVLHSGDATYMQRLVMMDLLGATISNTVVAVIDEPTFVGKSRIISSFLKQVGIYKPTLTFIVGADTLTRLVDPRYYGGSEEYMRTQLESFLSSDGDDSRILCSSRSSISQKETQASIDILRGLAPCGKLFVIDIEEGLQSCSSTRVRQLRRDNNAGWCRLVLQSIAQYIEQERLYIEP